MGDEGNLVNYNHTNQHQRTKLKPMNEILNNSKETAAYQRVLLARHPKRPYTSDVINLIFNDFVELFGDRRYADDNAIIAGFAEFQSLPVTVIGHQKGRDTHERKLRNFGMPKPEGYRKAIRVMKLAAKFGRPIITFVDTPGAYPGIDAEERGQAEAIAHNLLEMAKLEVPIITVILGEGGSGGALAIGICDKLVMLENAVYSVITPEGCAAILWKSNEYMQVASERLRLTAQDLYTLKIADLVIEELGEGAHENITQTIQDISGSLKVLLDEISEYPIAELTSRRYSKIRALGVWNTV